MYVLAIVPRVGLLRMLASTAWEPAIAPSDARGSMSKTSADLKRDVRSALARRSRDGPRAHLGTWCVLIVAGRNPFPFPDVGSRIFSASSPAAKATIVELLAQHGVRERFQADSGGVLRSIMWDGTIINYPDTAVVRRLGLAAASIGLVADDPAAAEHAAAAFLTARGFSAEVVLDLEPGLPIAKGAA